MVRDVGEALRLLPLVPVATRGQGATVNFVVFGVINVQKEKKRGKREEGGKRGREEDFASTQGR